MFFPTYENFILEISNIPGWGTGSRCCSGAWLSQVPANYPTPCPGPSKESTMLYTQPMLSYCCGYVSWTGAYCCELPASWVSWWNVSCGEAVRCGWGGDKYYWVNGCLYYCYWALCCHWWDGPAWSALRGSYGISLLNIATLSAVIACPKHTPGLLCSGAGNARGDTSSEYAANRKGSAAWVC